MHASCSGVPNFMSEFDTPHWWNWHMNMHVYYLHQLGADGFAGMPGVICRVHEGHGSLKLAPAISGVSLEPTCLVTGDHASCTASLHSIASKVAACNAIVFFCNPRFINKTLWDKCWKSTVTPDTMFSPLFGAITEASSVPNPRSSGNKDRLYVAYYSSGAQNAGRAEVDTALLLVPKRPKNAEALQSWQFRVTRPSRSSRNFWEFEGNPSPNRPPKLRALLLLGKVTSDFTGDAANKLLADVFVAQNDEIWGCTHWTRDAIQTLVEHEVIALLEGGASAREVWENGCEFAIRVKQDSKKPVPTCNQRGKSIASEVR